MTNFSMPFIGEVPQDGVPILPRIQPARVTNPVDYLINCLRGIAADGTDHPQVEMHRTIARAALDRYSAALSIVDFAGARSVKAPKTRNCPCGKCGYCDCDGCSAGTAGCDYAYIHAAKFPRELPPNAVLVDAAECRVLTPGLNHYPTEWGPPAARQLSCSCGNPDPAHMRPRVEDLPACGP